MQTQTVNTPEVNWQELTEFPGKGQVKILREQSPTSGKTLLIHIHPGGQITPHAHEAAVQHYIIEGEYETDNKIYGAGTYRLLPGHENVQPISTQSGATILMIYDPIH